MDNPSPPPTLSGLSTKKNTFFRASLTVYMLQRRYFGQSYRPCFKAAHQDPEYFITNQQHKWTWQIWVYIKCIKSSYFLEMWNLDLSIASNKAIFTSNIIIYREIIEFLFCRGFPRPIFAGQIGRGSLRWIEMFDCSRNLLYTILSSFGLTSKRRLRNPSFLMKIFRNLWDQRVVK